MRAVRLLVAVAVLVTVANEPAPAMAVESPPLDAAGSSLPGWLAMYRSRDGGAGSAQAPGTRPLVVMVDDRSTTGGGDLGIARTRVGYVFQDAGIRIAWEGEPSGVVNAGRDTIRVIVVNGSADHVTGDRVLGFAVPAVSRVYVYYDRVQRLALNRDVQPGQLLGDVIAHEIAHVLLPDIRHTASGMMAAAFRSDPRHPPAFTSQEAQALRARLGEVTLAE